MHALKPIKDDIMKQQQQQEQKEIHRSPGMTLRDEGKLTYLHITAETGRSDRQTVL